MTDTKTQQDSFTDAMSKYTEAVRHGMTASRLAAAGTMAIGAATFVYFADAERREAAMHSASRLFTDMTSWWQKQASGATDSAPSAEPAPSSNPGVS